MDGKSRSGDPRRVSFLRKTKQEWKLACALGLLCVGAVLAVIQLVGPREIRLIVADLIIVVGLVGVGMVIAIRCPHCHKSLGWWAFRGPRAKHALDALRDRTTCPRCDFTP